MLQTMSPTFLLSLATTLSGSTVDPAAVTQALALICGETGLPCGMVYGRDAANNLCLAERHCPAATPPPERLRTAELELQHAASWARTDFTLLTRSPQNTAADARLLDLFGARQLVLVPVADQDGFLYGFVAFSGGDAAPLLDETDLPHFKTIVRLLVHYVDGRMYHQRIARRLSLLETILDHAGIDVYVNDFDNHDIIYINESMAAPYGGREMFTGRKCWEVLFAGQGGPCEFCPKHKLIDETGAPTGVYSWDYQRAFDGSWFRVFSSAFPWENGRMAHVISSADITDNKRNEALIERLANYDQLTGLPNRRKLLAECKHRIDTSSETEQGYVLFFDIDGFKNINDTLGHDAGDEFLIALGQFFSAIPMLKDAIYRNGGDEFVAIVGGESVRKDNIRSLAHFIHARFQKPWQLTGGSVYCNTSIGVACYPEDGLTAEALLQRSDQAMYKAKKAGGGQLCFGCQLDEVESPILP